jgi:hypothetical protein
MSFIQPSQIEFCSRKTAARLPRELRRASVACAVMIALFTALAFAFNTVFSPKAGFVRLTTYFFQTQDAFWLGFVALLLLGVAIARIPAVISPAATIILRYPRTAVVCLSALVLLCGIIGTLVVFHGYHLSRDEFLAEFDATILRTGTPVALAAPEWQSFFLALAPCFMLPVAQGAGFLSAYLPVNAGLRALTGLMADPAWTSPLLAAGAVVAIFWVARRLFPSRPDAVLVTTLLVATSSQVLLTSMTSYAMTAHLTLNLLWLWLFLRDDKIRHAAAIGVGFLATGLHQLIFHPVFAFPFIIRLWTSGRRRLALTYLFTYAVICLFWIGYWQIVLMWPIACGFGRCWATLFSGSRCVSFGKLPLDGCRSNAEEYFTIYRLAKSDTPAAIGCRLSCGSRRQRNCL